MARVCEQVDLYEDRNRRSVDAGCPLPPAPAAREGLGSGKELGAAAVEFAIAAMLLIMLLFGAAEFGFLMQKEQSLAAAIRTGTRIGASPCLTGAPDCEQGNRSYDDFFILRGIESTLRENWKDVEEIKVYKSDSPAKNGGKPVLACRNVTTGISGWCNSYTPNLTFLKGTTTYPLLSNLERFYFTEADETADPANKKGSLNIPLLKSVFNCTSGPSSTFCPTGTSTSSGQKFRSRSLNKTSNFGVYVKMKHSYLTGIFGNGRDVAQWSMFRLEPHPLANDPIPTCTGTCTADVPPDGTADLQITKNVDKTALKAGDTLKYTITVLNVGPQEANGARVEDNLPTILQNVTWSCAAAGGARCDRTTVSGSGLSETVDIPVGGSLTYVIDAKVADNAYSVGERSITNTARVIAPPTVADSVSSNNQSSAVTQITIPEFTMVNDDGVTEVAPGASTTYTMRATNVGLVSAKNVRFWNTLPSGATVLSPVTWTCTAVGMSCPAASGSGAFDYTMDFPSNASITFMVTGTVPVAATSGFTNRSDVSSPDGNSGVTFKEDTNALSRPDLKVTKTDGSATTAPGANISYTIIATNSKSGGVTGARITDTPPTTLTNLAWSCAANTGTATCPAASGTGVLDRVIDLPGNSSLKFTVTAKVAVTATGVITNQVDVYPPGGVTDETPLDNRATDSSTVSYPDLSVTKTDGRTTLSPGMSTSYTIVLSNNNVVDVTGVAITDTPPAALTVTGLTCVASGGAVCPSGLVAGALSKTVDLPKNSSLTFTMVATLSGSASGTVANTATLTPPAGLTETSTANNTATDTDTIAYSDLSISKNDGKTSIGPGQTTAYAIVVTNPGPGPASGVTVADTVDTAKLTSTSWSCASTGGAVCPGVPASGSLSVGVTMPASSTMTFTLNGTLASGATGSLANTATVAWSSDPVTTNNSATDTDTIIHPDLRVTKTGPGGNVGPGQTINYTVTGTNLGPGPATAVTVADPIPTGIASITWSCAGSGVSCIATSGSGAINHVYSSFPSGATVTYTVTAVVSGTASGTINNVATISTTATTDPVPGNNSATASNTVVYSDLSISKTDGKTTISPGMSDTYTVVVTNPGPGPVNGVRVTDSVPTSLTSVTWTCSSTASATCPASSGSGSLSSLSSDMPPGSTVTYSITGTLSASASGTLSNTATVAAPSGYTDPSTANNTATDTTSISLPDLQITKTDGRTAVAPGMAWAYTITARNNGPGPVTGATVVDSVPSSLTAGSWTCASSGGATCPAASGSGNINQTVNLPASGQLVYTLNVTLSASATGSVANTATINPPAGMTDPTTSNNTSTDSNTIGHPDLSITKNDSVTSVGPGSSVSYTIVASNPGPGTATGATVADTIPSGLTGATWSCAASAGGSCGSPTSGSGTFSRVVNIASGGTVTFTVNATVATSASGTIANTATVTAASATPDPVTTNNSATDTDTVSAADLQITKNDGKTSIGPGASNSYTITVSNIGGGVVTGATVTDTMPSLLGGATWSCTPAAACGTTSGSGNISKTVTVASGTPVTFTVTGTVSNTATGTLSNTATVAAPAGITESSTSNNTATDTTAIVQPDLQITKTDGKTAVVAGASNTYTVVVTNAGTGYASGAVIQDTLDTRWTSPTWTCAASGGASCPAASGSGNLNVTADIPQGGVLTFAIQAWLSTTATGSITNTATVTPRSGITDPTTSNNTASDTDTISAPVTTTTTTTTTTTKPPVLGT